MAATKGRPTKVLTKLSLLVEGREMPRKSGKSTGMCRAKGVGCVIICTLEETREVVGTRKNSGGKLWIAVQILWFGIGDSGFWIDLKFGWN